MDDLFPPVPQTLSLFAAAPDMIVRVIDTETAGQPRAQDDAVIEIGSVDLDLSTGRIFNPMQSFVDPAGIPINEHARRVHRITDEMLAGAPRFADAAPAFTQGIGTYAAQRASFDRDRLRFTGRWLCTYKLALRAFPAVRSHGLQSLVKYLPLDLTEVSGQLEGLHPHRALYDALCTAVLLRRIAGELGPRCQDGADFLERAERVSTEPALLAKFRFGKHKGSRLGEVPTDYLEWVTGQPNMDADVAFTARYHLKRRRAEMIARMTRGPVVAAL
ncbi:exonuclease domain-containing protein [Aureimonas frigidaquae]|uniref:exonuclease domain-containing protein n=1 Tax=Aureimonas frigidaquae TaxID=424757 RepID=UPI0007816D38|nr:exonuclease domain-containing protein [Aureimonas frigidaquae]